MGLDCEKGYEKLSLSWVVLFRVFHPTFPEAMIVAMWNFQYGVDFVWLTFDLNLEDTVRSLIVSKRDGIVMEEVYHHLWVVTEVDCLSWTD